MVKKADKAANEQPDEFALKQQFFDRAKPLWLR
jgi:hypothetical protein